MRISVQEADFDIGAEIDRIRKAHPEIGALVSFIGCVRDFGEDAGVTEMILEHYPGMTENALEAILTEAMERWEVMDATVIHRVGRLPAADRIVLVLTASRHRKDAFSAAEFVIDRLKTEAPFWKKEKTPDGWRWVAAKASDEAASAEWE